MNQITFARRMIGSFAICLLLWNIELGTCIDAQVKILHSGSGSSPKAALRGGRRALNTITTPNCGMVRTAEYPAELQLFYTYSVEINDDLLLQDMERAIDNAVAIELDMCDAMGRPVYKIRTSTVHSFSTSRTCDPVFPDNTCIVVNGETAVLLDHSSDANFVRDKVYIGIAHGLNDVAFLNGFTNSVVSASLISEGHASLVENHDEKKEDESKALHRSGVTTTVAVAAASVTIVVASIFCYGFMRRPKSRDPTVRHRNRSLRKPNPIVVGSQLGVPMRRHFVRLEDLSSSPTFTASISPKSYPNAYHQEEDNAHEFPTEQEYYTEVNYNPAINWSVSDITSDSASLRSGVSRTPSMLERIEEEIEEDDARDEEDDEKSCNFSYSEDSTIITKALSKAGIVSQEEDDATSPEAIDDRCAAENKEGVLDISDLDPCFTILPENTEELFRDLEDLSSEGTQDSPLESIVLELRLSTDNDCDSFKTALSDATMISLPWPDLVESTQKVHQIPTDDSERSESSTMKSLISMAAEEHSVLTASNLSTPLKEKDTSDSFYTPPTHEPPPPRNEDIIPTTVSDNSDEDSFASQVESEMDGNETILDDASAALPFVGLLDEPGAIDRYGTEGTLHSKEDMDDDQATKICSVDSIDEWVKELMNQEPKENKPESTLAKT